MTEIDCLKLFISDSVIEMTTTLSNTIYTYIYIEDIKNKFQRDRTARSTDLREIRTFIGILYFIGSLRSSRKNVHKIWDNSKESGVELCYLIMSEI